MIRYTPPMNGRDGDPLPLAQPLTPREEEILILIDEGLSNRQIAEELTIALSTVKWYVRQIYNKLGVENRAQAVARARRLGLPQAGELEGTAVRPAAYQSRRGLPRNNLVAAATPFVGREEELAALADLIADPQVRLITLTGPGGIGKTRLALEAAVRELRPLSHFPGGIFFVSLAPLESAEDIVAALAGALDFQFQGMKQDPQNAAGQILNYLGQKQMLLVMDNFEHILEGRALLAEIGHQATGLTLLVTSRERLQMRGEQLFPLSGLELAQSGKEANEAPAAALFLNIARRTVPDFELLEGDDEQLLRICRLVEGMPLGLELAASWVGLLPLAEIAAEIERSLDLLAVEQSDVPRRHQSMQAALDASWRRLAPEQQRAFQALTVFRGGFTRMAALEVAGATLPLLVTLANKSWLSYDRQKDRYQIHELLRQYGAAKLGADPAHEHEVRARHCLYFCSTLKERESAWFGPRQKEVALEVGDDIDNIQRAWRWAAGRRDMISLAQGLHSLCRFYLWKGRLKDGHNACRLAADALATSAAEQQVDETERLLLWSQVLAWESEFVFSGTARKEELLQQSQQLLDQGTQAGQDTRAEQAFILLEKANTAWDTDFEETKQFASQALDLYREIGDRIGEAQALMVVGSSHLAQGHYDLAKDFLGESLAIRQQLGDEQGIAETMTYLGMAARHRGDFEAAEALHRQSVDISRQAKNRLREQEYLGTLSYTLSYSGKFLAAKEAAGQAIVNDHDLGHHPDAWHFSALAMATIHLGDYSEAQKITAKALELARQKGLMSVAGWALMFLGNIAFVEGKPDEAKYYLQESVGVIEKLQHIYKVLPRAVLSYVYRALGDKEAARHSQVNALREGTRHHSITPILYCLPAAALLAADNGHNRRAIELYGLAQQFGHIRNSHWFADVAGKELDGVRTSLPPDVAAAEARGRELDVWQTADSLLRELDGR